jgi:hypothetical protein
MPIKRPITERVIQQDDYTLSIYNDGDVYYFVVEDEEGETIEGYAGGYYGLEYATEEGKAALNYAVKWGIYNLDRR